MFRKYFLAASCAAATAGAPALAQDVPLVPLVPPELGERADVTKIDLNGTWEFATANHTGGCPGSGPGFPMNGLIEISQQGGAIGMQVVSGAECRPAGVCAFTGEIADGDLILWNSLEVDDEGGTITQTLHLIFQNDELAQGVGGALYMHPKMKCIWNWDILVHRPEMKDGEWQPGAAWGQKPD